MTTKLYLAQFSGHDALDMDGQRILAECRRLQAENERLREALRRTVRWVGKGIADGGFNCVAPQQAEHDLDFAEDALKGDE